MAALWLFGAFFLFLVLRAPVAFALGLACLPGAVHRAAAVADGRVFNTHVQGLQLVHPARRAVLPAHREPDERRRHHRPPASRCRERWSGNFPGALAQINVLLSVFFAGISGSSTADAASQGKIFIEAQVKEGYDLSFSIAITAVSAVLAVIIPPSILMIVWGGVLSVSIGALYLAGVIPGLLIGLAQMADRPRLREDPALPDLPARDVQGVRDGGRRFRAGADDAVHHRRRHPARLVHRHRSPRRPPCSTRLCCRSSSTARWTRRSCGTPCSRPASCSAIALFCVGTASVFGWLLAVLPDPEGAARERHVVGSGTHRRRVLHRLRLPGRRLLPRRDPGDHHRRHHAAAAGRIGAHASGVVRDHRHRRARLRPRHAAVRACA